MTLQIWIYAFSNSLALIFCKTFWLLILKYNDRTVHYSLYKVLLHMKCTNKIGSIYYN